MGELVPVEIEGVSGKRFVVRDDVELLQAPPEPPPSVAFLCLYDPLVDRKLLGSLFDFDYVWELYVPPEKRRWGWYVLPIVFRDRLVGRIEPKVDRAEAGVQVLAVWWKTASLLVGTRGSSRRCATGFAPTCGSWGDAPRMAVRLPGREETLRHRGTHSVGVHVQIPAWGARALSPARV